MVIGYGKVVEKSWGRRWKKSRGECARRKECASRDGRFRLNERLRAASVVEPVGRSDTQAVGEWGEMEAARSQAPGLGLGCGPSEPLCRRPL